MLSLHRIGAVYRGSAQNGLKKYQEIGPVSV